MYTSYVDWKKEHARVSKLRRGGSANGRDLGQAGCSASLGRGERSTPNVMRLSPAPTHHHRKLATAILKFLAAVHQRSDDQHGVGDWRLCLKGHFCKNVANFAYLIFAQPRWPLPTSGFCARRSSRRSPSRARCGPSSTPASPRSPGWWECSKE